MTQDKLAVANNLEQIAHLVDSGKLEAGL